MNDDFFEKINLINSSRNPLKISWALSLDLLNIKNVLSPKFQNALFSSIDDLHNGNGYHDHYHLSHVIFCSAYLLKHELDSHQEIKKNAFPLLFAALFHDAGHLGRSNKYPYELEDLSIDFFDKYSKDNSLEILWNLELEHTSSLPQWYIVVDIVKKLIKSTEFAQEAKKVNDDYINNPDFIQYNDPDLKINRLRVILIEADILLSSLAETGPNQTRKIGIEHGKELSKEEINENWINFVKIIKDSHYNSKAAQSLGLKEILCNILEEDKMPNKVKSQFIK